MLLFASFLIISNIKFSDKKSSILMALTIFNLTERIFERKQFISEKEFCYWKFNGLGCLLVFAYS